MANVYSYLRFSSIKQAAGTSIDRQLDYAQRWAAENGLPLDESLTMRDEGLSAYHQRHVKTGALGAFLQAINEGRIPPGSVLIVEGLDRLSRADPIDAQAQLTQIINAGITVVTAGDGKQYSREKLKANPMDIIYSVLVMVRANEESETKSKRVKAAIRKHCEAWQATGKITAGRMGRPPSWLRWIDGKWEIIEERAEGIRTALDLFGRGWGHFKITEALLERKLNLGNGPPNSNQLYRIIRNTALKGVKSLELEGDTHELTDYYPALVSAAQWASLQDIMNRRARAGSGGPSKIVGMLSGSGIAICGYCGSAMVANNVTTRTRSDGSLSDGNRRLICSSSAARSPCPLPSSVSAAALERAIMNYCSDRLNLRALLDNYGGQTEALRGRLAQLRGEAAKINAKIDRLTELLLTTDETDTPAALIRKMRDLEAEQAESGKAIRHLEQQLLALDTTPTPAAAEAWEALRQGVEAMDYDSRVKARQLIADTFERIVIFSRGTKLDPRSPIIEMLLVGKGGGRRSLRLDRKSGMLIDMIRTGEEATATTA